MLLFHCGKEVTRQCSRCFGAQRSCTEEITSIRGDHRMTHYRMRRAALAIPAFITGAILIFSGTTCTPYTQPTSGQKPIMHGGNTSGSAMMGGNQRGAYGIK